MRPLKTYLNIEDLRVGARNRLPKGVFEYMDLGAEDMIALGNNRDAFRRIQLYSRIMNDVSKMDLSTTLFGKKIDLPIGIAPTAISGLCWHEGEVALARAAAAKGVPFILSTNSITPMEKVARLGGGGRLWFQLYMWRERELSYQLVARARDAGYEALVVSADFGRGSNRENIKRNGFSVPYKASVKSVTDMLLHPSWLSGVMLRYLATHGMPKNENFPDEYKKAISKNPAARSALRADSLVWTDIERLRERWKGPLMVKGVMHPEDARLAVKHGADGVIVSNHGGRNMDSSLAAIDALPAIVNAVGQQATVIMDSGIRRGSDIAKALIYGAKAVLVGRATLYGVSVGGQAGAERAMQLLGTELDKTMAFLGCSQIDALNRDLLVRPPREEPAARSLAGMAAE